MSDNKRIGKISPLQEFIQDCLNITFLIIALFTNAIILIQKNLFKDYIYGYGRLW